MSHRLAARQVIRSVATAAVVGVALLAAAPAHAAFPGANGKLAFETNRDGNLEVYAMNPDGTGQTRLTNNPAEDSYPAWSPDATKIAFSSTRDDPNPTTCSACNYEVYVMNADGTSQTRLTTNAAVDRSAVFSPDGTMIAFRSERDGNQEVYRMNADGSGQTRLTNNPAADGHAAWSPDGAKIAFVSDRDGNQEIYAMNPDGTGQTRLTNNAATDADPTFSPDGSKIAFVSTRDGNFEIYAMNADGTGQTRLTNNAAVESRPAWSPDGKKIAFVTDRDANNEIYAMNADGSAQTRLTNNPALDSKPDWQPLATALKSAASLTDALVPVYKQCGTAGNPVNAAHGPPALDGSPSDGSCTPAALTGTARMGPLATGTATITAIPGDLTTPANEADDRFQVALTDVRTAAGADYNPNAAGADLTLLARLRVTDTYNCSPTPCSAPYDQRATLTDLDFSVPVDCANTASSGIGATCSANTTANALIPNAIREGKQGVLSVFRVRLNDSGPDGIRGSSDDKLFAQQGSFVP